MPGAAHVTDPLVDELIGIYDRGILRLDGIVSAGLRRGLDPSRIGTPDQVRGDATHGYRVRQLGQARAVIEDLIAQTETHAPRAVAIAYRAGAISVDRRIGAGAKAAGTFGLANHRAVEAIAQNMTGAMTAAIERTGRNIATVFERADALEAGLPVRGIGGFPFIGRRVDDPWRAAALEQIGQGLVAGDTRRQVTAALMDRLVREGTADALTGYVARNGARIPLNAYAKMVARTTTREAVSRGTVDRLTESGLDLVTISSHPHNADECTPYDGNTFSLDGKTPGYDVLDELPPFHPNCLHVLTPAGEDLDAWEAELGTAISEPPAAAAPPPPAPAPRAPRARAPAAPPAPPAPAASSTPLRPDAVSVRDALHPTPLARRLAEEGLDLVDQAHVIPPGLRAETGRPVPIRAANLRSAAGQYAYRPVGGQAVDITVDPALPFGGMRDGFDFTNTLTHEVGHYIDHQALGTPGEFTSTTAAGARLRQAFRDSRAYQAIEARKRGTVPKRLGDGTIVQRPPSRSDLDVIDYLLDDRELFARAYAQWVAGKATGGRRELLELALSTEKLGGHSTQWDPDDFAPIREALEDLFRSEGLLK